MEPGTIENLIDFALENYGAFNFFPRDQIRRFFEIHQDTTVLIRKAGRIKCFLVWEDRGSDAIEILGIAAIGSWIENIFIFWDLWEAGKKLWPQKKIYWQIEVDKIKELKCLSL